MKPITNRFLKLPFSLPLFSPPPLFLPSLLSFLPLSLYTVRPLITDAQTGKKTQYTSTFRNFVPNLPVSATLVLPVFSRIFQYLQYWYDQHFLESSSICNTGITSIVQDHLKCLWVCFRLVLMWFIITSWERGEMLEQLADYKYITRQRTLQVCMTLILIIKP